MDIGVFANKCHHCCFSLMMLGHDNGINECVKLQSQSRSNRTNKVPVVTIHLMQSLHVGITPPAMGHDDVLAILFAIKDNAVGIGGHTIIPWNLTIEIVHVPSQHGTRFKKEINKFKIKSTMSSPPNAGKAFSKQSGAELVSHSVRVMCLHEVLQAVSNSSNGSFQLMTHLVHFVVGVLCLEKAQADFLAFVFP